VKLIDLAAVVGAAAWFPQIFGWLYRWLAKPKLRVVSGPKAEIGYNNTYNAIANLNLAISASRKDAIIERMTIETTHENGDKHLFTWVFLNEFFSEMRNQMGERVEVAKNQSAIALKISTLNLTEKKVLFQDLKLQQEQGLLVGKLGEMWSHLKGQGAEGITETIMKSQEFVAARDYFRDKMFWREGKYTFTVSLYEISGKKPHVQEFEVFVKKADADSMRRNADKYEQATRELYEIAEGKPAEEIVSTTWEWVYPEIRRL
jgi:hypothetical protein